MQPSQVKPSPSHLTFWLWLLLLLILNVIPTKGTLVDKGTSTGFRFDCLTHFLAFLILPVIYRRIRYYGGTLFSGNQLLHAFVVSGVCAIGFEYIQHFLPYRTFNPQDLFYNLLGVIFGYTVVGTIEISRTRYRCLTVPDDGVRDDET